MEDFEVALAAITSIILFIFGLEHFSKELQKISGESFRRFLARTTKVPVLGVLLGAIITSIIQSSSATSVIAISLVNAGILSFKNSIGIILGANVGTTVTAQLIAFKLTNFAPYLIILGFLLSLIKSKFSIFGKSLFYFGFVFFTLNLISSTLQPLQNDPRIVTYLTAPHGPLFGIIVGFVITAIIQSSSVTTGLAVVFTAQGFMSIENAIPILMGANLGTTVTALISIFNMDRAAKKTAFAHFLFNFGGVLLFLPFIYFDRKIFVFSDDPAIALANFHLFFNVSTCILFLIIVSPLAKLIEKIMGEGKMDFARLDLSFTKQELSMDEQEQKLLENEKMLFDFIQENYNLMTLSLETNYKTVFETAKKRVEYVEYIRKELVGYLSDLIGNESSDTQLKKYINLMNRFEYLYQLHDSTLDLVDLKEMMDHNYIEIRSDLLMYLRELTSHFVTFFEETQNAMEGSISKDEYSQRRKSMQDEIDLFHQNLLKIMTQNDRKDTGAIFHLVSYSQRLKDKLVSYQKMVHNYKSLSEANNGV